MVPLVDHSDHEGRYDYRVSPHLPHPHLLLTFSVETTDNDHVRHHITHQHARRSHRMRGNGVEWESDCSWLG